jgi:hypothetical protein
MKTPFLRRPTPRSNRIRELRDSIEHTVHISRDSASGAMIAPDSTTICVRGNFISLKNEFIAGLGLMTMAFLGLDHWAGLLRGTVFTVAHLALVGGH